MVQLRVLVGEGDDIGGDLGAPCFGVGVADEGFELGWGEALADFYASLCVPETGHAGGDDLALGPDFALAGAQNGRDAGGLGWVARHPEARHLGAWHGGMMGRVKEKEKEVNCVALDLELRTRAVSCTFLNRQLRRKG